MKIKEVSFLKSITHYQQRPQPAQPSFVFLGRSNVGKSSLINTLLGRKQIAKTSSKPGKTQLINYFTVNQAWYLVDAPGYGWAHISQQVKKKWTKMVRDYLLYTAELISSFLLIDSRHPPQQNDLDYVQWLGENKLPFSIVFTKADLPKKNELHRNVAAFKEIMKPYWSEFPPFFTTSSRKKIGIDQILSYINKWLPVT